MHRVKNFINDLSKSQKIIFLIVLLCTFFAIIVGIPTLSKHKNRIITSDTPVWDGKIASSYRSGDGSADNPYIISNGSELAYFYVKAQSDDYENTYFELKNNIILNKGIFKIIDNEIKYLINENEYLLKRNSDEYIINDEETKKLNVMQPINNFKGNFKGNFYTIYGLYMFDYDNKQLALFTNLNGNVEEVYLENAFIDGGNETAVLATNATNANIKNVLVNGIVNGNEFSTKENKYNIDNFLITPSSNITTKTVNLNNNHEDIIGPIVSSKLKGSYKIVGNANQPTNVSVNGNSVNEEFEIDLSKTILTNLNVSVETNNTNIEIEFNNLEYTIIYEYGISAGILTKGNNVTLENLTNYADITSHKLSSGIIGLATNNLNIKNSYNQGTISSNDISSGVVGVLKNIENSVTIDKIYNIGIINSANQFGIIGNITNVESLAISNSFNTSNNNFLGNINNSIVRINNCYSTTNNYINSGYLTSGYFRLTTQENLKNKNFIINNFNFNEYTDDLELEQNSDKVWIYEDNEFPVLYFDSLKNPIVTLNINSYSWNNLTFSSDPIKLNTNITFNVEEISDIKPVKEIYYYINESKNYLNKNEILELTDWVSYNNIIQITKEGYYTLYIKAIDFEDNITYVNSDLLILDTPGVTGNINYENYTWNNYNKNLDKVYINNKTEIKLVIDEVVSKVVEKKYYISNVVLTENQLNEIKLNEWIEYNEIVEINKIGDNIVYFKIIDDFGYNTYFNSGNFIYNGYLQKYLDTEENNIRITDKSSVKFNMSYQNNNVLELEERTHNVVSNILLPMGTKIKLIDNINNEHYQYKISTNEDIFGFNDCDELECLKTAKYPFELFSKIGNIDKFYQEKTYYNEGKINENFTVIIDFSDTNITTNYENVLFQLQVINNNNEIVIPTLENLNEVNIYSNVNNQKSKAEIMLKTDFTGNINLNQSSMNEINLINEVKYQTIDSNIIYDTTFYQYQLGIIIKMLDMNGNVIPKEKLKNLIFKLDDKVYSFENDNAIRINLNNEVSNISKKLVIINGDNKNGLEEGYYSLNITNIVSYNGKYGKDIQNEIDILVNVNNNLNDNYNFDVSLEDNQKFIDKKILENTLKFDIFVSGNFKNPTLKLSMYKKRDLTAYNQFYTLIDANEFINNNFELDINNTYKIPLIFNQEQQKNKLDLSLKIDKFEYLGYKLVFELYDGEKFISQIEKYVLAR